MKKILFQEVAILGLGLIGGSSALDLQSSGLVGRVVGYSRSAASRRLALRRRACSAVFQEPKEALRQADLVILATPVRSIPGLAKAIAPSLKPGALISDVGSTKQTIVRHLKKILPAHVEFIGGHPIAGTEHSGMAAAQSGLFRDRWWILTPDSTKKRTGEKVRRFSRLLRALGARTVFLDPQKHDRILGGVSHLPHMAAYGLLDTVFRFGKKEMLRFAGSGFRDTTRIAASSAEMWTDICLENSSEILSWLKKYQHTLAQLQKWIAAKEEAALKAFFEKNASIRRKL